MANYREISQRYAQGAINAAILVNGGAAVAVLSQVGPAVAGSVRIALALWAFGIFAGAATWILGFFSTRFVDKSELEPASALRAQYIATSDRYMQAAVIAVVISLGCFAVGAILLAIWLPGIPMAPENLNVT